MTHDVAIVTGAAAGLGSVIARTLSRSCRHLVIADQDGAAAAKLQDELARVGDQATSIETDMCEEDQVRALIDRVATLGRVSVLVNNAGGWLPGPQFPVGDAWHRGLDLNLRMPMLATQLCLPLMSQGGAVVNISSSGGWDSGPYGSPEYGAAKAGLIRFTTAVADFTTRFKVRVSCIVPHWIGLDRAVREFEQLSADQQRLSGGLVDPQVIADTVMKLIDDPNSGGRVIVIRAGQSPYQIDPATSDPQHQQRVVTDETA
jgi:NAD(P)-dependent dehydrogenase (short-subunit alcohol dehydrogenase family)